MGEEEMGERVCVSLLDVGHQVYTTAGQLDQIEPESPVTAFTNRPREKKTLASSGDNRYWIS